MDAAAPENPLHLRDVLSAASDLWLWQIHSLNTEICFLFVVFAADPLLALSNGNRLQLRPCKSL